jgi:hypothetical protein
MNALVAEHNARIAEIQARVLQIEGVMQALECLAGGNSPKK